MENCYVRLSGGLGNQMFQYAFYLSLLNKGKPAKIDLSWYDYYNAHNGFELRDIFCLDFAVASKEEINDVFGAGYSLVDRVVRKFNISPYIYMQGVIDGVCYDETLYGKNKGVFIGYYQSEKYFSEISDEVKRIFSFPLVDIDDKNSLFIKTVKNEESVSVHIRRGDYVNNSIYMNVCDLSYYTTAINYIKTRYNNPHFYIFSNDIKWCKENLVENAEFIDWNYNRNSFYDMLLMRHCKHHIIANSSFSWWGAWLGADEDGLTIAPRKWFNLKTNKTFDVIPQSWIKL